MAYFISANARFTKEICIALSQHFHDFVEAHILNNQNNEIEVEIVNGYPEYNKSLTNDELERGVIGGGYMASLDGLRFKITIEEVANATQEIDTKQIEEVLAKWQADPTKLEWLEEPSVVFIESNRDFTAAEIIKEVNSGSEWGKRFMEDLRANSDYS